MSKLSNLDEYYLKMLTLVAGRSTCARRAVGAIIIDDRGHVLSTGYNGVPSTFPHCIETPCAGRTDPAGDTRRCMAIHAELNALLQCSRLDLARCMYVSCSPCFQCAKVICNTSVKRVVCQQAYADTEGVQVLQQRGIAVVLSGKNNAYHSFR